MEWSRDATGPPFSFLWLRGSRVCELPVCAVHSVGALGVRPGVRPRMVNSGLYDPVHIVILVGKLLGDVFRLQ